LTRSLSDAVGKARRAEELLIQCVVEAVLVARAQARLDEPLVGGPPAEHAQHRPSIDEPRRIASQIRSMAAVRVGLRPLDESSAHRVQVDVADQGDQVLVGVADNRLVATLKEMTDLAVNPVEPLGVGLLQSLHELRDRPLGGLQQQVDMIRHQAVRIQPHPVSLPIPRQPGEIGSITAVPISWDPARK
jgi:hypothetical protein